MATYLHDCPVCGRTLLARNALSCPSCGAPDPFGANAAAFASHSAAARRTFARDLLLAFGGCGVIALLTVVLLLLVAG